MVFTAASAVVPVGLGKVVCRLVFVVAEKAVLAEAARRRSLETMLETVDGDVNGGC